MYRKETPKQESIPLDLCAEPSSKSALDTWTNDGGSPVGGQIGGHGSIQRSGEISKNMADAMNRQIQQEQSNAHAYHALSLYFREQNLHGLERFMSRQAEEECSHADKFIGHLSDRKGRVELLAIHAPRTDFNSPLDAAKHTMQLEISTSQMIHRLYDHACNDRDYPLQVLLHWFITEQVEEERWSDELVSLIERFNDHPAQLLTLDHLWAGRAKT